MAVAVQDVAQVVDAFAAADVVNQTQDERTFRVEVRVLGSQGLRSERDVEGMLDSGTRVEVRGFAQQRLRLHDGGDAHGVISAAVRSGGL